jgi:hypothetical protein
MPRFRPKGVLERSALAHLFKRTLSQIPTTFGRLAYLASLRDPNSGGYRHHGLFVTFGREEGSQALETSHRQVFSEWISMPLEGKYGDLLAYLDELEDPREMVIRHWTRSGAYQPMIPASATDAEKALYLQELQVLLDLLSHAAGAGRDRSSWPRP